MTQNLNYSPSQNSSTNYLLFYLVQLATFLVVTILIALRLFIRQRRAAIEEFKRKCKIPLLNEPGPFGGNLLESVARPNNCQIIDRFHHRLGLTYGLFYGPDPWVMSIDLDLIQRVFITEGLTHVDVTDFRLPFVTEMNESLAQVGGDKWRSTRRCMGPSFTPKSMKSDNVFRDISNVCDLFEEMLDREQRRQSDQLNRSGSVDGGRPQALEVDAHDAFKKFSLEVIFRVAFGVEHSSRLRLDRRDEILERLDRAAHLVNGTLVHLGIMFAPAQRLVGFCSRFTPLGACIKHVHSILGKSLAGRCERRWQATTTTTTTTTAAAAATTGQMEPTPEAATATTQWERSPSDRKLIDSLIERFGLGASNGARAGLGPASARSRRENEQSLKANLFFIMLAGHETSSNTLAIMFWLLAKNQRVQERLREAIVRAGASNCEYLDWVIWETLRLHPAVPTAIGRVLECDIEHGGVVYPRGSTIVASIWSMHRWPAYWGSDAAEFRPERFGEPSNCSALRFFAFGEGPRYCIGKHLAMAEIKAIVMRLLVKYRIGPCRDTCASLKTISPNLIHFIVEHPIKLAFERITNL